MSKILFLAKGKQTTIDNDDFGRLSQWKWHIDTSTGYVVRNIHPKGKVYLHRVVNKTPVGKQTDHINRDKLDNRKFNLRTVASLENIRNTGLRTTNKSGFKGVWWWKSRKKWVSYIWKTYKKVHLGVFETLEDAVTARNEGERLLWQHQG